MTEYIKALEDELRKVRNKALSEDNPKMVIIYTNREIGLQRALELAKQIKKS